MKGIDHGSFWSEMQASVELGQDIGNSTIKCVVFAFTVTWIALFNGYNAIRLLKDQLRDHSHRSALITGRTWAGFCSNRIDVWELILQQTRKIEFLFGSFVIAGICAILVMIFRSLTSKALAPVILIA